MKTREVCFDGDLYLIIPDDESFYWPAVSTLEFPACCGPEKWNDRFYVFDRMFGLCISPACWVHDRMWDLASASWQDFHYSNSVFLHNLLTIINTRSESDILRFFRRHKAFAYYDAIDLRGAHYFWDYKESQGYDISSRKGKSPQPRLRGFPLTGGNE